MERDFFLLGELGDPDTNTPPDAYPPLLDATLSEEGAGCDEIWASIFVEIIPKIMEIINQGASNTNKNSNSKFLQRKKIGEYIIRSLENEDSNTLSRSKQRHLDR